ncbi:MAG TPA: hypothetical protein VHX92_03780 [Rhizomicrobium sp.]|jgi:hypothetical protein|nr:hypothetical protein [Rhizomicrobium sp.]
MSSDVASPDLAGAIDVIEETYEYMLAYAAQGRVDDTDTSSAGIRAYLERSDQALGVIASAELSGDAARKFLDVMRQDAAKASAAIGLVLAKPAITSQMIDNLNASVHLRTLLTDIFLLDETLEITPS